MKVSELELLSVESLKVSRESLKIQKVQESRITLEIIGNSKNHWTFSEFL